MRWGYAPGSRAALAPEPRFVIAPDVGPPGRQDIGNYRPAAAATEPAALVRSRPPDSTLPEEKQLLYCERRRGARARRNGALKSGGPILPALLLTAALAQAPASALVCAGVRLRKPVRSLVASGDSGLVLTESGRLYALSVTRSGLEVEPVSGVVLPPDASLISVVVSGPSLGFTAVRATASSLVMYRGVASREGSEFAATVHEEVMRFDELSDRLRSGEWGILELAGPVSDGSGDLYAAALLEPVDGDLVVEVWDVSRRRLVKLSLGDGRLLVACEGSVAVIPRGGLVWAG